MKTHPFAALVAARRNKNRKPGEAAITVKQLAKNCKVSRQYFYSLMTEATSPSLQVLERVSKALDVSVPHLRGLFDAAQTNGFPKRKRAAPKSTRKSKPRATKKAS